MNLAVKSKAHHRPGRRAVAIVPAAGCGKRLGMKTGKPFVLLKGKPIIAYTLEALERCEAVDEIVIASEPSYLRKFEGLVKRYRFSKVSGIVAGGRTRFESVKNCLSKIGSSFDIVIVHDGARPFIDAAVISESVNLAGKFGACIVGSPETDTVKIVDRKFFVKRTLDRSRVFRAETPQTFKYDIIKKAYAIGVKAKVTDDAGLLERLGLPVKILAGTRNNMKITTKEDLRLAEALL